MRIHRTSHLRRPHKIGVDDGELRGMVLMSHPDYFR
jgi:hypothetical protein